MEVSRHPLPLPSVACTETTIAGITLRCHVLSDGRRHLEDEGYTEVLVAIATGNLIPGDANRLVTWLEEAGYGRRN